jgi:HEAT repeat protein
MMSTLSKSIEATLAQVRDSRDTRALSAEVEHLSSFGPEAIPLLINAMRVETTPGACITLAKALAAYGRPAWGQLLEAARRDDSLPFGHTIQHAVPRFTNQLEAEDFIEALGHPSPHVRAYAAYALIQSPNPRAVDPLIVLLAETGEIDPRNATDDLPRDIHSQVRSFATLALRMCREMAVPALLVALESKYPLVRAGAARALRNTNVTATLAPLRRAANDPEITVRLTAIQAFASLIPRLEGAQRDSTLQLLLDYIRVGDRNTSMIAGQSLAYLGALAIDPLCELAVQQLGQDDSDDALYGLLHAFIVLLQLPQSREARPRIVQLLGAILQSPNRPFFIRRVAVEALKRARSPQAIALLIALIEHDANADIRLAAAQSFQVIRDPSALPALREAVGAIDAQMTRDAGQPSEADERVRQAVEDAIQALEELRDSPQSERQSER